MSMDNEKNIKRIADAIKKFGHPNTHYKGDLDIEYGLLKEKIGDSIGGLMALLRTMKKQNQVTYVDQGMLQPSSVVTLLQGSGVASSSDQVPYDGIKDTINDKEKTSHARIGAGTQMS